MSEWADWMEDTAISFPHLGIYLKNVPKSFTVFGFTIAMYGVLIGIGVLLAFTLISKVAKRDGQNPDDYYEMGIWILILGILGARLYYVIFAWEYYKDNLIDILNIRQGGLAIYGGVIVGFVTAILYCRHKKWNIWQKTDTAFTGVLVGQIVGRFGNFTNREVFGDYTDSLFAMRLPVSAVRSRDISEKIAEHITTNYIQVHPTFLYESFCNLVLLILILSFFKKRRFYGEGTLWYLGGYGIIRFFVEGIRTDQLLIPGTQLPVSQFLGAFLFLAAVAAEIVLRLQIRQGKGPAPIKVTAGVRAEGADAAAEMTGSGSGTTDGGSGRDNSGGGVGEGGDEELP